MIISPLSANNEPHEAKRLAIDINTRKANSIEVEEIPIPERVGSQKIAEVLERYYREMPDTISSITQVGNRITLAQPSVYGTNSQDLQ